jgi:hypothetical protein
MLGLEYYCVCVMEDKGCWDGSITVYASWKIRDVGMGVLLWMSDMVAKFP